MDYITLLNGSDDCMIIIKNTIQCKKCGDIIESISANDLKTCSCRACAVDGGHDYLRRCGELEDFIELSEIQKVSYAVK